MMRAARVGCWFAILLAGLTAPGCDATTAEEHYSRALADNASGEVSAAIIEFKNALQKKPDYSQARLELGKSYLVLGDPASALKELERARDLGVDSDQVLGPLLEAKVELGRYQEVLGQLEGVGSLSPELLVVRGEAVLPSDPAAARRSFEDALANDPSLARAYLGLAQLAVRDSDRDAARRYVEQGLAAAPKVRLLWVAQGELAGQAGEFDTAKAAFERAAQLPGNDVVPQVGIARIHIQRGEMDAAESVVDDLLRKAPKSPVAHYLKALIAYQRHDVDSAERELQVVQQVAADYPPGLLLMGMVKFQQQQYAQVETLLGRYITLDPGNVPARLVLAASRLARNDAAGAVGALAPVADAISDSQGLSLLGTSYMRAGMTVEATAALRRAAEAAPDASSIRRQLALSLLAGGQPEGAINELQKAIELDPKLVETKELLITVKLQEKQFDEARDLAVKLTEEEPKNPIGYNLQAAALLGLKDVPGARRAFERALEADPTYATAAINLMRLDLAENHPDKAKRRLDALLQANPSSLEARVGLAELALRSNDAEAARQHLESARLQHPDTLAPRVLLGQLAIANGDRKLAEEVSGEAIRIAPDNPDALLLRAKVELAENGVAAATPYVNQLQAIFADRASAQGLVALGGLQWAVGQLDRAKTSYERALPEAADAASVRASLFSVQLAQNDVTGAREQLAKMQSEGGPPALIALFEGDLATKDGQLDNAVAFYRKATDLGSQTGVVRLHVAELHRGRPDAAAAALSAWLETHPDDSMVELALAGVRLQQGNRAAAKALYERIQQRNPSNTTTLNNLAWLYFVDGDERAEATARQAQELEPRNPEIADTLGWILVGRGQLKDATPLLELAASRLTDNGTVQYHLAVAYEKAGRRMEAKQAGKRALLLGDFPERSETEALMQRIEAPPSDTGADKA